MTKTTETIATTKRGCRCKSCRCVPCGCGTTANRVCQCNPCRCGE